MEEEKNEEKTSPVSSQEEVESSQKTQQESQAPQEPGATPKETDDPEKKFKGLYRRYKTDMAKKEQKIAELEKEVKKAKERAMTMDPEAIASVVSALAGLDATERDRLIREAKLLNVSLSEARNSEDFKLWRSAYRAKKEKEKVAPPSTKQSIDLSNPKVKVERFKKGEMTAEEKYQLLRELGVVRNYEKPTRPGPPKEQ